MYPSKYPKHIIIELTSRCNGVSCRKYCPRGKVEMTEGDMDKELYYQILCDIRQSGTNPDLTLHRRGESTLHPDFIEMLAAARDATSGKIMLATNGIALTDGMINAMLNNLDFVNFSMTPEIDQSALSKFMAKNVAGKEKLVEVQASFVDDGTLNKDELTKQLAPWVDVLRFYACHSQNGNPGSLEIPRATRKPCMKPSTEMAILWDGTVVPCPHWWVEHPNLGKIVNMSIAQVWQAPSYKQLRNQHKTLSLFGGNPCATCDSWYETTEEQGTGEVVR